MIKKAERLLIAIKKLNICVLLPIYALIHSTAVRAEHAFEARGSEIEPSKRAEIVASENSWEKWDKIRTEAKEQTLKEKKCFFLKEINSLMHIQKIPQVTVETINLKIRDPVLELECNVM